ncbi:MAG: HD-GYP domain-containing protein [Candidatus Omnitrophota bacterium]|nr:HD-GYP domain-containing protein [Candidatus Omnitrophota bacterium]
MSKIKTPEQLFTLIEEEIAVSCEMGYLAIFALSDNGAEYIVKKQVPGLNQVPFSRDVKLDLNNPIIEHLSEVRKPFLIKEINENLEFALIKERQDFLSLLRNKLVELEAEFCLPGFVKDKMVTVLMLGKKASGEEFSLKETELFSSLAACSAEVLCNFSLLKKEVELFVKSIRRINKDLEIKDPYTRGHSKRVAEFSIIVGRKFQDGLEKVPYGEISLYYAAELHDLGKINVSDSILNKKGALNAEEYDQIKEHPLESVKMIAPLGKWFGRTILDAVLYHHENYDGTGYPYGKKGEEINILARIIRVVDSFDAMITDRPYRKALLHHFALSELKKGRGTLYDPRVIDVFLEAYKEGLFKDIFLSEMEKEKE